MPFSLKGEFQNMEKKNINSSINCRESHKTYSPLRGFIIGFLCGVVISITISTITIHFFYDTDKFRSKLKAQAKIDITMDRYFWEKRGFWDEDDGMRKIRMEKAKSSFLDSSKKAEDMSLYSGWMKDWLLQGNELDPVFGFEDNDDYENFPFESNTSSKASEKFYIISDGVVITPLYGNSSVKLVAPKGTEFKIASLGHNEVYFWDDNGVAKCEARYPVLYPEVIERLEKMNIPELNEALEENLKNKW